MTTEIKLTGRMLKAARALAGIGRQDFATAIGISVDALRTMEAEDSAWLDVDSAATVARVCEKYGVVPIEEGDGMGAGVRLKFTRQDVKQLVRLEGEGGVARPDAAP